MNSTSAKILSYFFPQVCLSCHGVFEFGEEKNFCDSCEKEILYLSISVCKICGEDLKNPDLHSSLCGECLQEPPPFEWARSVFELSPALSKILYSFKYSADETALSWMSQEMYRYLENNFKGMNFNFIIPVPLHAWRLLRRGYNQTLLLANALAQLRNEKVDYTNLIKPKSTSAQSTLSKKERVKQLRDAFELKNSDLFNNKRILLVDDVYTTGSTLQECARVLKEAGASVCALTLARTPLKGITPPVPPLNLRGDEGRRI